MAYDRRYSPRPGPPRPRHMFNHSDTLIAILFFYLLRHDKVLIVVAVVVDHLHNIHRSVDSRTVVVVVVVDLVI